MIEKPFVIKQEKFFDKRGFFQEIVLKKKIKIPILFTAVVESKKKCYKRITFPKKK